MPDRSPDDASRPHAAPAPWRRSALKATFGALLLPGAGHIIQGARWTGLGLSVLFFASITAAVLHLLFGLSLFESPLGSLLFGALLRQILLVYAFSVLDVYLSSTAQGDAKRRKAVFFNLLLPGSGHLWLERYPPAAIGFGALALLLFIGRNPAPHLDLILVVVQGMAALGVYHYLVQQAPQRLAAPGTQVPAAQISVLLVVLVAIVASGWTLKLRWVDYGALSVSPDAIKVRRSNRGLRLEVAPLALKLEVVGAGWRGGARGRGALFRARHRLGASLMLGVDPIQPFVRFDRYLLSLRRRLEEAGYALQSAHPVKKGQHPARRWTFERRIGPERIVRRRALIVRRGDFAYVLLLNCERETCDKLGASWDKTLDTFELN